MIARLGFFTLVVAFASLFASCGNSDDDCGENRRYYNGRCVCDAGYYEENGKCLPYAEADGDEEEPEFDAEKRAEEELEAEPEPEFDAELEEEGEPTQWTDGALFFDSTTRLIWQRTPPPDYMTYSDADLYCEKLELQNVSDWRVPSISELITLINGCDACSNLTEPVSCNGCKKNMGPALGCYYPPGLEPVAKDDCGYSWSSTDGNYRADKWEVYFGAGAVYATGIGNVCSVRCAADWR